LSVVNSLTNQIAVTVYYDKTDDWYPTIIALLNEYRTANPNISVKHRGLCHRPGRSAENQGGIQAEFRAKDKDLSIFDCGGHVKVVPGDALTQVKLEQVPESAPSASSAGSPSRSTAR
jgi:hypothetical protein